MKHLISRLSFFILALSLATFAHAQFKPPVEGKEFVRVTGAYTPPVGKKVEVMEFFMYSCSHCFNFDPKISAWSKTLPKDVLFTRVSVGFNAGSRAQQQLYYTLLAMGKLDTMHSKVFNAIHVQRTNLNTPAQISTWAAAQGLNKKQFDDTFNSFSVKNNMNQATKIATNFKVDSVPTFIIGGKYLTSASMAGSEDRALQVINYLIDRARRSK